MYSVGLTAGNLKLIPISGLRVIFAKRYPYFHTQKKGNLFSIIFLLKIQLFFHLYFFSHLTIFDNFTLFEKGVENSVRFLADGKIIVTIMIPIARDLSYSSQWWFSL